MIVLKYVTEIVIYTAFLAVGYVSVMNRGGLNQWDRVAHALCTSFLGASVGTFFVTVRLVFSFPLSEISKPGAEFITGGILLVATAGDLMAVVVGIGMISNCPWAFPAFRRLALLWGVAFPLRMAAYLVRDVDQVLLYGALVVVTWVVTCGWILVVGWLYCGRRIALEGRGSSDP